MASITDKLRLSCACLAFAVMEKIRNFFGAPMPTTEAPAGKIYEFLVKTIDGKDKPLSDYKGKVLLIVNTASLCGFTPQYEGLEKLHALYKDKGLRVLGFPANEFGAQEPGKDAEIKEFCRTQFSIGFDMFSKVVVKGPGIHPLYKFLTTESGHNGDIPWNFSKFLIGKDGRVVGRFGPQTDPLAKSLTGQIEALLS